MPRYKGTYPDRVCPVCEKTFTPTTKRQIYDTTICRVKANRDLHKGVEQRLKNPKPELTFMLERIRQADPENAHNLELLAVKAGQQLAEEMIFIGYQLLERGGYLHAKRILIESGEVTAKKKRKPKS